MHLAYWLHTAGASLRRLLLRATRVLSTLAEKAATGRGIEIIIKLFVPSIRFILWFEIKGNTRVTARRLRICLFRRSRCVVSHCSI